MRRPERIKYIGGIIVSNLSDVNSGSARPVDLSTSDGAFTLTKWLSPNETLILVDSNDNIYRLANGDNVPRLALNGTPYRMSPNQINEMIKFMKKLLALDKDHDTSESIRTFLRSILGAKLTL